MSDPVDMLAVKDELANMASAREPVIVKPCRKQVTGGDLVMRDWIQENITMKRGLVGAKPERVVHWALRCAGALPDDEIDDMYVGSGAVTRAIETWRSQMVFETSETVEMPA